MGSDCGAWAVARWFGGSSAGLSRPTRASTAHPDRQSTLPSAANATTRPLNPVTACPHAADDEVPAVLSGLDIFLDIFSPSLDEPHAASPVASRLTRASRLATACEDMEQQVFPARMLSAQAKPMFAPTTFPPTHPPTSGYWAPAHPGRLSLRGDCGVSKHPHRT